MAVVIDASATVDLLLGAPRADAVRQALRDTAVAHAPELVDPEVLAVLRRWALRGWVTAERADELVSDFAELALVRHSHGGLQQRIWELRHRCTTYDACYVALAEVLGATLLTTDDRLARAARSLVDVVGSA